MQFHKFMEKNNLIIASAGSGKTEYLVNQALTYADKSVLITTYTENNEHEIKKRIYDKVGYIPKNIIVQTWFSFLLQHGVRPYQSYLYSDDIKGIEIANGQSAKLIVSTDIKKHYLNDYSKIYSDKIAKFIYECNKKSNNAIITRLEEIYSHIFIDEVQDLAGYDLEVLKLFFNSKISILLVGDPRQAVYSTNNSSKNKRYAKQGIINFFEENFSNLKIDDETLIKNYRCIRQICELSNMLFPKHKKCKSGNNNITDHDGIFIVDESDVMAYLKQFNPVQLRYNKSVTVDNNYQALNFGESKGLSFERVLIYPTCEILKWLQDRHIQLKPTTCSKLYVAITRARQSVAFVGNFEEHKNVEIKKWMP